MDDSIYYELRAHIDQMPAGYPATTSGAEIKILKKFYTPCQARIAIAVGPMPEPVKAIAGRLNMAPDEAADEIESMAMQGSLFRIKTPDGPLYSHPNFVMGLYEFHVQSVDKEVAEFADDIYDSLFENHWKNRKTKQLRIVPVQTSVETKNTVKHYDLIRKLVSGNGKGPYAVAPCICRVEQTQKNIEVTRPLETCLTFGMVAQYYIDNGIGKPLSHDELMEKLDECEAANLVPFSTNSKEIVNMCMCDKDSCQLFRNLRKFPKPAEEVHAAFYAEINEKKCIGCRKCARKCQIEATIQTDIPATPKTFVQKIDINRCIGCGLCVASCPKNAITMKEKDVLPDVPDNAIEMSIRIATEREHLKSQQ